MIGVVAWKPLAAQDVDDVVLASLAAWVALHGPAPPSAAQLLAA
jgi:hypothetical protein